MRLVLDAAAAAGASVRGSILRGGASCEEEHLARRRRRSSAACGAGARRGVDAKLLAEDRVQEDGEQWRASSGRYRRAHSGPRLLTLCRVARLAQPRGCLRDEAAEPREHLGSASRCGARRRSQAVLALALMVPSRALELALAARKLAEEVLHVTDRCEVLRGELARHLVGVGIDSSRIDQVEQEVVLGRAKGAATVPWPLRVTEQQVAHRRAGVGDGLRKAGAVRQALGPLHFVAHLGPVVLVVGFW
mmetsp:Transcript_2556/g.7783  ORF Transcript_2556/g.7783 Transcript_2556/m.7783 type:complete len:248 (+) Transcript_2556:189-932(+)